MKDVAVNRSLMVVHFALLCAFFAEPCHSKNLRVLERRPVEIANLKIHSVNGALRAAGDTIMFICNAGLYVRCDNTAAWRRVIDCVPANEQVPLSVCDSKQLTRIVLPRGLWRIRGASRDEIVYLERLCGRPYSLHRANDGSAYMQAWGERKGEDGFRNVNIQDGTVLCGMERNGSEETVVIQQSDDNTYRRVFKCPDGLARVLDSVGLANTPFCIPALDPHDSTLWLAIEGYHYIYVISMDGELRDSVPIAFDDYRRPPPLKSRMKSDAVIDDWFTQWTYITSFSYVPQGYFVMQYLTGHENCGASRASIFSTHVWDTQGRVVPLEIDPRWQMAGVQSDGRIIFAQNEADSSGCSVVLYVTRIEP